MISKETSRYATTSAEEKAADTDISLQDFHVMTDTAYLHATVAPTHPKRTLIAWYKWARFENCKG